MLNTTITNSSRPGYPFPVKVILFSALLAGTLDILAAFTDFYISTGKSPVVIVSKFIASGVMGPKAFAGGTEMIVLGITLHYIITLFFTVFFFLIYPHVRLMRQNRWITAILYGLFAWAVMRFMVVPLSGTPRQQPLEFGKALRAIVILIVMIGIPFSFIAHHYYARRKS
jgi:hypothetical protein